MSKAVCCSLYCDPFLVHNAKLLLFVIYNCFKKVVYSLKTAQNYIMNDTNDKRPFPLHEQSWYRIDLLKIKEWTITLVAQYHLA